MPRTSPCLTRVSPTEVETGSIFWVSAWMKPSSTRAKSGTSTMHGGHATVRRGHGCSGACYGHCVSPRAGHLAQRVSSHALDRVEADAWRQLLEQLGGGYKLLLVGFYRLPSMGKIVGDALDEGRRDLRRGAEKVIGEPGCSVSEQCSVRGQRMGYSGEPRGRACARPRARAWKRMTKWRIADTVI